MSRKLADFDIVFFLAVDSGLPRRQNFVIRELARQMKGQSKFLCVERPICPVVSPIRHWEKFANWLTGERRLVSEDDGMFMFTPFVLVHDLIAEKIPLLTRLNGELLALQMRKVLERLRFRRDSLITWVFHPQQLDYINLLKQKYLVYDIYDEYQEPVQPTGGDNTTYVEEKEKYLLERAHVVFAASRSVADRRKKLHPNAHHISNAVDIGLFRETMRGHRPSPTDVREISHPLIGFIGSVNEGIDFGLIAHIASVKPEWSLVLVGPVRACGRNFTQSEEFLKAKRTKNVHFLGSKPYSQIPEYIKEFDVCFIPYKMTEFSQARSPLKLYEYLAAGKPVVSTCRPEVDCLGSLVRVASKGDEVVECIAKMLAADLERVMEDDVPAFVQENNWEVRVRRMVEVIEGTVNGARQTGDITD